MDDVVMDLRSSLSFVYTALNLDRPEQHLTNLQSRGKQVIQSIEAIKEMEASSSLLLRCVGCRKVPNAIAKATQTE